jgi:putative tryptophan/tyrosine transport system substrate-binding protein
MTIPGQDRAERRLAAILAARVRRRKFMALVSAAAAWSVAARAQQPRRFRRVGVLSFSTEDGWRSLLAAFFAGLKDLGWVDGDNLHIDTRFASGKTDRMTAYASELIALSPDVILAVSPLEVRAIQHQTSTVPIVFALAADPISQGIVENLAHPGGNVTGFSSFEFSMGGKWLEIFKEVAPHIHRVSLIFNPETASYMESFLRSVQAVAKTFEMEAVAAPVHDVPEMERVFARLSGEPGNGLIFPPDVFTGIRGGSIVGLVAQYRLPAVYSGPEWVQGGGLLGYGPKVRDNFYRAASYVDRIFKGARPADLPVQAPTKFQLSVNLRTAKALGLTIPESFLLRADEVIE